MCGIFGITCSDRDTVPLILDGLKRLEYRGYDSAGIAVNQEGTLARVRAEGKLSRLDDALRAKPIHGTTGIGHTRWATHGAPNEVNAHPHMTEDVAVVHNGIIENYQPLREELSAKGYTFSTQTDTEVVPVLVTDFLKQGKSPGEAVAATLERLEGAFALGFIFRDHPGLIIAARRGSPLAIGHGEDCMYMGSDAIALAPFTQKITYLEEDDWVELRPAGYIIHDVNGEIVNREVKLTAISGAATGKGNFRHFMLKEIYEQPTVIGETLNAYYNPASASIQLGDLPFDLATLPRITIVACGTSYYAGLVAKYWLERIAGIPVDIDVASEFRYREAPLTEGGAALFISQSGETADTLAALRFAKKQGQHILSVVNVPESSMANESDLVLRTYAGPEIGVASTKAFTTQLVVLACLTLAAARARGHIPERDMARLSHALAEVPSRASEILNHDESIAELAVDVAKARDVIYLGRGTSYAIALEGALKLKEISYIHAEGYAAGEMKHGPIALIDEHVPVIVVAPQDRLFDKTASNIQEVAARGGRVVLISDAEGESQLKEVLTHAITLPRINSFVAPILYAIPVQLLAYHVAVLKGTDVDQPRNLAKSVTVE